MLTRKHMLAMALTLALATSADAQTFYTMGWTNADSHPMKSLVILNGENGETSEIRTIDLQNPGTVESHLYTTQQNPAKGSDYAQTGMESADNVPWFVFIWDTTKTVTEQRTPYVLFPPYKTIEFKNKTDYFYEVSLLNMREELVAQFYSPSDPMYSTLVSVNREAVLQEKELVSHLPNGSRIFRTFAQRLYHPADGTTVDEMMDQTYYPVYYDHIKSVTSTPIADADLADLRPVENVTPGGSGEHGNTLTLDDADDAPATLHLLVVANTEIDDIGTACGVDGKHMTAEMKGVASMLNVGFRKYDVSGEDLSRENVVSALAELKPAKNDIVVFLYSGHGFRWNDQQDPYPMLALTTSSYTDVRDGHFVALSDIYSEIVSKGARLNIVMSDCCNAFYGTDTPLPLNSNTLYQRSNSNFSASHLRELFLDSSGSIITTAASPGEVSWCTAAGGNYVRNFIDAFRSEISLLNEQPSSWTHIFDTAIQNARRYSENNCARIQNGLKSVNIK